MCLGKDYRKKVRGPDTPDLFIAPIGIRTLFSTACEGCKDLNLASITSEKLQKVVTHTGSRVENSTSTYPGIGKPWKRTQRKQLCFLVLFWCLSVHHYMCVYICLCIHHCIFVVLHKSCPNGNILVYMHLSCRTWKHIVLVYENR